MTLGEMLDELHYLLGNVDTPDDGELIAILNRSQDRLARDLNIPQYHAKLTDVTGEEALPSNAREAGLIAVHRDSDGHEYDLMTVSEADQFYPGWKNWDAGGTVFIVYDPKMIGLKGSIRPVPMPSAGSPQTYVLTYLAKPGAMTTLTDEPWDGHLEEFHDVIVHHVASQVLLNRGDRRANDYYALYQQGVRNAMAFSRPSAEFAKNPLWDSIWGE